MADLRKRFIEDYAGGLLNVARQELSTLGEVLSQDGFTSEDTLFVEDGSGVKSGLKLGVGLAEAIDPTTSLGVVNVRYADRTYASIKDLKIFSTAVASAQAALSEAVSTSILNVETTVQLLEDEVSSITTRISETELTQSSVNSRLGLSIQELLDKVATLEAQVKQLSN